MMFKQMSKKYFDIPVTSLSVLHNYFDGLTKLFSDLYLVKFLDSSAKPFFPCDDNSYRNSNFFDFPILEIYKSSYLYTSYLYTIDNWISRSLKIPLKMNNYFFMFFMFFYITIFYVTISIIKLRESSN